jgi:hypothetical protein
MAPILALDTQPDMPHMPVRFRKYPQDSIVKV